MPWLACSTSMTDGSSGLTPDALLRKAASGVAAPLFFLFGGALCVAAVVVAIDIAERPIEKTIIAHGIAVARAATAADLLALGVAVIGTAAMLFGARQLAARLAHHRAPATGRRHPARLGDGA